MTTNSNIDRRAMATARTAAGLTSAPYQGAAGSAVVYPSQSAFNHGGLIQRQALRPEGWARKDRRQLHN
jgi:hypothetical protein